MEEDQKLELFKKFCSNRRELDGGSGAVLTLRGEWSHGILPALTEALDQELSKGNINLVLDFTDVESVLSAHLGVIWFRTQAYRSQSGDIRMAGLSEPLQDAFARVGILAMLHHFDTEAKAVESFSGA